MIRYLGYAVTFEEVPDEVSLCISITGCTHRCPGCHSPELWQESGRNLEQDLPELIGRYMDGITCVCLMGEGNDPPALQRCIFQIREKFPGLKICVYSGGDLFPPYWVNNECLPDYIKVGHYDHDRGGLDQPTTNQVMYQLTEKGYRDITYKFWKKQKGRSL